MRKPTSKTILKASEVAQFSYCSVAWHLERQGYKPESPYLERGLEEHVRLGVKIESLSRQERTAKRLRYIGCALLFLVILLLVWWLAC